MKHQGSPIELSDDLLFQLLSQFKRPDDLGFLEFVIRSRPHVLLKDFMVLKEIVFPNTELTFLFFKSAKSQKKMHLNIDQFTKMIVESLDICVHFVYLLVLSLYNVKRIPHLIHYNMSRVLQPNEKGFVLLFQMIL
jgi:hypothetical protein